ncbi:PX domain-containing protein kinase-like protein [Centruroides sculpturatus]|uniref:PX domain-containing protein kinase-like protein n=1 Tax=Centruroides sculpturatus TaxID=218467 RepID=UPI000C6D8D04|nr:PX domain-containing protein kinase-like protein [Centruroides sculpturatus]
MAVFEKKKESKLNLDDTQCLTCTIEAAENVQDFTIYIIRVQRGPFVDNSWQISRRYSDFDALNNMLQISGVELPLPPKRVFGKLGREFVAERQQGLQQYMNTILSHPMLALSLPVKRFLDPENYSQNFLEIALQHVSMVFRSELRWEIVEPFPDIGM